MKLAAALALLTAAALALPAAGQTQPIRRTIATFPACGASSDGVEVVALDPRDGSDCTTGGGTVAPHPCVCDAGSATWVPAGRTAAGDLGMEGEAIRFRPAAPGAGATGEVLHIGTSGGTLIVEPLDVTPAAVTAGDDGRTRGGALSSTTYCSGAVKCAEGQGGCNNNSANCATGLFCRRNIGRNHKVGTADWTGVDICVRSDYWCARTCTAADKCRAGQGDCAGSSANCQAGLVCVVDGGAGWNCGATVDVCQAPSTTCSNACSGVNQCANGTGHCTGNLACLSNKCTVDAGAYYGCPPGTSICEP